MAHVLTIIPKGFRASKKVQTLNCLKDSTKNIQQRLDCAAKVKPQLETDAIKRNINIQHSAEAGKVLNTLV